MKAGCDGGDESALPAYDFRIQIRIHSAQNVGQKSEEGKLHRQLVPARGHQIRFQRAQSSIVRLSVFVAELVPARPPAGANHVQTGCMDLA